MSDQQYMTNFTGEDMKISYAVDSQPEPQPTEPASVPAGEVPAPEPVTEATDPSQPPDGTSKEVMDWVGDDKDRAQAALDKEQANEKPRVGLTEDLEKLLEEDDE